MAALPLPRLQVGPFFFFFFLGKKKILLDFLCVDEACVFSFRETCSLSKTRKTKREVMSEQRIHEEYAKLGSIRCVFPL